MEKHHFEGKKSHNRKRRKKKTFFYQYLASIFFERKKCERLPCDTLESKRKDMLIAWPSANLLYKFNLNLIYYNLDKLICGKTELVWLLMT